MEMVGWVERQQNPTNDDNRWVSFLKRQSPTEGNPLAALAPQPTLNLSFWLNQAVLITDGGGWGVNNYSSPSSPIPHSLLPIPLLSYYMNVCEISA